MACKYCEVKYNDEIGVDCGEILLHYSRTVILKRDDAYYLSDNEGSEKEIAVCPICYENLAHPNPFTLDELKNMQYEAVWVVNEDWQGWAICNGFEWKQGHITDWINFSNIESLRCDNHGKDWFAYPHKIKK